MRRLPALTVCLMCVATALNAVPVIPTVDQYAGVKKAVSETLRKEMKKNRVTGLSIALVDDQCVVWAEGFGYADAAAKSPATADTLYCIGSITKLLTATEVMRLVERGKADLDQPLTRYVPEFSIRGRFTDAKPITVRSLLAHHSGLPSDRLAGMWVRHPVSLTELVSQLADESLATPPQTQYKYSNLDFSLLGRLIEKVEGRDYASVMREDLLVPIGMTHSCFRVTPETERMYSKGYRDGRETDRTPLRDAPAGGLLSSANDMGRFVSCMFAQGAPVIEPKSLKEMWTTQFPGLPLDFGKQIGLAWMLDGLSLPSGERPLWHNGGAIPFQAHLSILPERKLGVVILSNTDEASKFITEVGIKALALAVEAKCGVQPAPAKEKVRTAKVSSADLERFAGPYVMMNGQLSEIGVDGGHLKTSLFGQRFDLIPTGADTFIPRVNALLGLVSVSIPDLTVQFQTVEGHDVAILRGLPAPFAFERVKPVELPAAWKDRLGKYRADTTAEVFDFGAFELTSEKGLFVAKVTLAPKDPRGKKMSTTFALRPISDTEAVVVGLGDGEGGTIRAVERDGKWELLYSGFRFTRQ